MDLTGQTQDDRVVRALESRGLADEIVDAYRAEARWRASHPVPPLWRGLGPFRAAMRALSDDLARELTAPAPASVQISEVRGAGRRVRVYRPAGVAAAAPTQLFLHGGGFVLGAVDEEVNDRLLAARADLAGVQVLSLDYPLAPRHRYPAAADATIALLDAVRADPPRWGADPARLGLAGVSAGGGIAASAALLLRDRARATGAASPLRHLLLEVPAVSLRAHGGSFAAHADLLPGLRIELLALMYAGWRLARPGPASPLHVGDLSGLPPTSILTAEFDPLRDAGEDFARRLAAAGVAVETWRGEGHLHSSGGYTATWAAARHWQDVAARFTRKGLT